MTLTEFEKTISEKLDDLCSRIVKIEEQMRNHLINVDKKEKSKREKIYITIAVSSAIIAIYQSLLG